MGFKSRLSSDALNDDDLLIKIIIITITNASRNGLFYRPKIAYQTLNKRPFVRGGICPNGAEACLNNRKPSMGGINLRTTGVGSAN